MPAMRLPSGTPTPSVADLELFSPLGMVSAGKNLIKESNISALLEDIMGSLGPRRPGGGPGKGEISSFFAHGEDKLPSDIMRLPKSSSEERLARRATETKLRVAPK